MNVFVLNSGRCGSTTFIKACEHITNYTCAHESRMNALGDGRVTFPQNHIEADNRLCWFLGRLDEKYGQQAIYVHLSRSRDAVARSFSKRFDRGIMKAYAFGILTRLPADFNRLQVAEDYCRTIDENINLFLRDKPRVIHVTLENARDDFKTFWNEIGAEGDLDAALKEFEIAHNATPVASLGLFKRGLMKMNRIWKKLPTFISEA